MANMNIATIHDVLTYAHDVMHNRKALSKEDFEKCNATEQAFTQWETYVNDLRKVAVEYVNLTEDPEASDQKIDTARRAVYAEWRTILEVGAEDAFHPGFFIRKEDAAKIGHWGSFTTIDTAVGRVAANNGKAEFRKRIETLIGIRMAGNKILTDAERELLLKYEGSIRTIDRLTKEIDGFTRDGKEIIHGLKNDVADLEATVKKHTEQAKKYGLSDEDTENFVKFAQTKLDEANAKLADATKTLVAAKKVRDANKVEYDELRGKLRTIGMER